MAKVIREWACECGRVVTRFRGQGDVKCGGCGQWFNAAGQRLRNDWMDNPAWQYDEVDDVVGYERQMLAREKW